MYFFVFITYVFYCFCCFISFPTIIQLFWPKNKHLNYKQNQITNVLSLYLKNEISICFVHKSQKWAIFGLTCKDKRTRDLVMVGPIFEKFLSKDSKEKSHKISVQDFVALINDREKCRGGGGGLLKQTVFHHQRVSVRFQKWQSISLMAGSFICLKKISWEY